MPIDEQITLSFPARPEYLRLARLTSADVASRAGFDFEQIDDLRIAVSELCSLIVGDADTSVTLTFAVDDTGVTVDGDARGAALAESELSTTIIEAVLDELDLVGAPDGVRFRGVKRRD